MFNFLVKMNNRIIENFGAVGTQGPQNPAQPHVTTRERVTQREWGTKGPLLFHTEQDRLRHCARRLQNRSLSDTRRRRKRRCDHEKWRIATLNINGTTTSSRMSHLKREMQDRRIDIAFLQETLYADTVDQLYDYTIINSGSINAARKRKWGASVALHPASKK